MGKKIKYPSKIIFVVIGVIIIIILIIGGLFTFIMGDRSDSVQNTFYIKNNTDDTLYLEKPIYGQDERQPQQVVTYIGDKQFLKVLPKSTEVYYLEDYYKSFDEAVTKGCLKDTFELIQKADTLKFIYGEKQKCQVEIGGYGFYCTRSIK